MVMKAKIINELRNIEFKNDVTVLYACESGSRAWGFDNVKSDYDVRFIFKRNDLKDYVSISSKNEVIEVMDGDLDIVGWDIKKALYLHYKSNPNLREWLISPIKYLDWESDIFNGLPDFDRSVLKYHYMGIAGNNWKKISNENLEITKRVIKMYLYNCRCILAGILLAEQINPPINIFELLNLVECEIKNDICYLIGYYKGNCLNNLDLDVISRINHWIRDNLEVLKESFPEKGNVHDLKVYDEKYFEIVLGDFKKYI